MDVVATRGILYVISCKYIEAPLACRLRPASSVGAASHPFQSLREPCTQQEVGYSSTSGIKLASFLIALYCRVF